MKTLADLCKPRASVFDKARLDTVYNLDDLSSIHPDEFLSENYVTEGMRILLTEAFNRLEGKTTGASGTFLLSQSMGGGKTHNLITLGLLAKYPKYRKQVMADFFKPGDLGAVTVIAFSGQKTSTPFGIWGEIAEQLNRKAVFNEFYSPLKPPDPNKWVELLRGEPVLILLDELPPYFEAARAVAVGDTYLDRLTEIALANLLVAVNSNKLPRACVVITDLSGTAYAGGSASITQALQSLNDLEQEVNRNVVRIDPVKINTNEIYHILRTRIFEKTPSIADIEEVADAYGVAVDNAKKMVLSEVSPNQLKTDIRNAYPFHPAIRDLYARFKENRGFQQTRALIRIVRLIVSHLWSSGAAAKDGLIGAHEFDLQDASMLGEIRQINAGLEVAVARDIAAEGGSALAVKGADENFRIAMVECYCRLAENMPDNGLQLVMFTHQDVDVWADLALILWSAGLRVTAAWTIATETDTSFRTGKYVQDTVLLVLRKRKGTLRGDRSDIYPDVQAEVQRQLKTMLEIDDKEYPNFGDSDYQLAAYAAALRVVTAYSAIEDIDVERELRRIRRAGESSPLTDMIRSAVRIASDFLVPDGLDSVIWKRLLPEERFYIKGVEIEAHGEYRDGVYQEFARGFGIRDYRGLLGSGAANQTRLKTPDELKGRDLSGEGFARIAAAADPLRRVQDR